MSDEYILNDYVYSKQQASEKIKTDYRRRVVLLEKQTARLGETIIELMNRIDALEVERKDDGRGLGIRRS